MPTAQGSAIVSFSGDTLGPLAVQADGYLDGAREAYAASQTTVLHMKRLDQTESPIFVSFCGLCFQRLSFLTFLNSNVKCY